MLSGVHFFIPSHLKQLPLSSKKNAIGHFFVFGQANRKTCWVHYMFKPCFPIEFIFFNFTINTDEVVRRIIRFSNI
jgi:hypothetical protein